MVCAGAGFSLLFAETILLAIVMALVNAGIVVASMFWAKSFLIASLILILGKCGW